MTKTELEKTALGLPATERRALANALLESLDELPLQDWQKRALDEALGDLEKYPDASRPAVEVLAKLREEHARACRS